MGESAQANITPLTFNPFGSQHTIFTTVDEKLKVWDHNLVSGGSEQEVAVERLKSERDDVGIRPGWSPVRRHN